MAAICSVAASRAPTASACATPSGCRGGSPWPSVVGNGRSGTAGAAAAAVAAVAAVLETSATGATGAAGLAGRTCAAVTAMAAGAQVDLDPDERGRGVVEVQGDRRCAGLTAGACGRGTGTAGA